MYRCFVLIYSHIHFITQHVIFKENQTMDSNTFINALLLCLLNVIFMVAGIFLNSVVIISLKRSSQLRKKLCYFMILLLSCFDLAVVAINHPILISSTIRWSMDTSDEDESKSRITSISIIISNLNGYSMSALLTLSFERFLALRYPFFHQTAVTKRKLVLFLLTLSLVITVSVLSLKLLYEKKYDNGVITVFVLFFLILFIFLNYNMLIIAKSKRKVERCGATHDPEESKRRKLNFKKSSTCLMAVGCFSICSCPCFIYSGLRLTSDTLSNERLNAILRIWSSTLLVMNSTFNCVIFFWRNSILRREGMKIFKCFKSRS